MKRLFVKGLAALAVLVSAGFLASSCEREPGSSGGAKGTVSLQRVSGVSQKGRIQHIDFGKQPKLPKRYRLNYVATIEAPLEHRDWKWSATSVTVDPGKKIYITWHSNLQATEAGNGKVTEWGGALDVVDINNFSFVNSYLSTGKMKFNNLLISDNTFFLAATHYDLGGAVARVGMQPDGDLSGRNVECIGFPGASVNAIARYNDRLVAVSGYNKGTYATFSPDVAARPYDYVNTAGNAIKPMTESLDGFGGKYAVSEGNNAYVLYDAEDGAKIIDMYGHITELGVRLTSAPKKVEIYNDETGEWELTGEEQTYYGKHTMVVRNGIAYVACGYSGMLGVNLSTGAKVHEQNLMTVGLAVSGNRLFAATSKGLRIYDINEDGSLELYAFEVETYDETGTGAPTSDDPATIGTSRRHSPNFVTVDELNGYIYVAYGQSGVRVYKFETGVDMGGTVLWSPVSLPGYFAWGEIFCLDDEDGKELEYDGKTYRNNDGSYYSFKHAKNIKSYGDFDQYRFFDVNSYVPWKRKGVRLTRYQWEEGLDADGKPVSRDGYTVLQPMDDAATVRLGKGWRMPTKEEWEELLSLQSETVYMGQQGGVRFKAENGNEITLPQNGYRGWNTDKTNPHRFDDSCFYWSASLSTTVNFNNEEKRLMPGNYMQAASFSKKYGLSTNVNLWSLECKGVCVVAPNQQKFGKKPYMHLHDRCCAMGIWPVKDKPSAEESQGASK
ncbi:MAG: hypothetical protein NC396_05395 [Bacteroides sp.]|nr:hypothetical protein [Bacteroides sp.]MCM1085791.1 hypothetical protein [Bacteroides sp.]